MVPKLCIKIRQAVLRALLSNPKARASGYSHTYFDNTDINLSTLASFPTDEEIEGVATAASQEADSLVALLGLVPDQIHRAHPTTTTLPSIGAWFSDDSDKEFNDIASDTDTESISSAQELQDLLDGEENNKISQNRTHDQELLNLTCAALAITTDDMINM